MRKINYNCTVLDMVLNIFDERPDGFIDDGHLSLPPMPADQDEILSFLVSEGLLEKVRNGLHITYKGRMVIHQGGFKKAMLRDRVVRDCAIVAAIAGAASLVLQVVLHFAG